MALTPPHLARLGFAVLGVAAVVAPARAQDTHYWTEQFGNRAYLLSGAVVGDAADLSAIYYNPGGLALNESKELLLAGLGIDFTNMTIKDAVAEGENLAKSSTRFVPSLIAGEIPVDRDNHRFAYSLLTRHRSDLRMFAKLDLPGDALAVPTVSLVSNTLAIETDLSEYWLGGTWAYQARPSVGVGVTTFLAVRDQRGSTDSFFQVLGTENRAGVIASSVGSKYRHWRLLWKIGAAGQIADWALGVTATTRSIGLFGSGDVTSNSTLVGQAVDAQGRPLTFIASNIQHNVAADYRSPFSLAVGASRTFGSTTLHFSTEWFEAVSLYEVLDAKPFASQSSGIEIDAAVREQLNSVVNIGVAAEHVFDEGLELYFGFHTDFSGTSRAPTSNLSFSKWDFYHVSGGATFGFQGTDLTLGANLALASDTVSSDADDPFRPVGLPDDAEVSAYRLTLILGFNFSI